MVCHDPESEYLMIIAHISGWSSSFNDCSRDMVHNTEIHPTIDTMNIQLVTMARGVIRHECVSGTVKRLDKCCCTQDVS